MMERKKIVVLFLTLIVVVLGVIFFQWRSANVISNLEDRNYKVGDNLSGEFSLRLSEKEVDVKTPILISLTDSKDNVLYVKTLSLDEFIEKSNNPIEPVEISGQKYYETPGMYYVNIDKLADYQFADSGEYILSFTVLGLNFNAEQKITVD